MEEEGQTPQLPLDAWWHVFRFLTPSDLIAVGAVCAEWHTLAAHNHVWRGVGAAMQPTAFYPHYAAHLEASAAAIPTALWQPEGTEGHTGADDDGEVNFRRAFFRRCKRDLMWEGKQYDAQKIGLKSKWDASVRGVAISPKNKELFSAAAYDGVARVFKDGVKSKFVEVPSLRDGSFYSSSLNSTRWTCDGAKVAFGCHAKSLFVYDAETMEIHRTYENSFFGGSDRAPLAAHPEDPNLLVGAGSNNSTLTVFDLRLAQPIKEWNPHGGLVRDVCFVEGKCFGFASKWGLASISETNANCVHVSDFDAGASRMSFSFLAPRRHAFYSGAYSVAFPPPYFGPSPDKDLYDRNRFVLAGAVGFAESFSPVGNRKQLIEIPQLNEHFWAMRYNSNGTLLFLATDNDTLELFRRHSNGMHTHLHTVYLHGNDIEDCDIAPDDSYVVTASQDGSVAYIALRD